MKSFRLRLAFLVGTCAALLVFGAGYYAWRLSVQFNLDRLDRELRNLGAANLDRVVGDDHWKRVESALQFVSGTDHPPAFALRVENYGRELYRSPHWPRGIDTAALPKPTTYEKGRAYDPPPPPPRSGEPLSPRNPPLPRKEPIFVSRTEPTGAWRVAIMGSPYTNLLIAANIDEFNADLTRLRVTFLAAVPVALLMVGGIAWYFAGRALRPVEALTRAVERVTARGLDQRLPPSGHDLEFQRLVTVFNEMMDRLERSFGQAERFSGDASHELKTPLALLQAELEQALATAAADSAQQATYSSLLEDVVRLKAIVQKLLLLSLADSGRLELHREPTQLGDLVENVIEDCSQLAPGLTVERDITPGVTVLADPILLEQVLQNIADNALKYNRENGRIRFGLRPVSTHLELTVGNTGPGITPEDQVRLFERFFRGDQARTPGSGSGTGLGLSLSREIVRAHGGDLTLHRTEADWTEFLIRIPLATESATPPAQLG